MVKFFKNIIFVPFLVVCFIILIIICSFSFFGNNNVDYYKKTVAYYSEKYNLSPELVFAVIKCESNFNKNAVSNKGAVGLMQLMPSTATFIAQKINFNGKINLKNPQCNINLGCAYINYLLKSFLDENVMLCAYNAGENKVRSWLVDGNYSKDGETLDKIPFKETEKYIKKVEKYKKKYYRYLVKKGYYEIREKRQFI